VGGAAWSAYTLAHALHQHGHTVTAVVPTLAPRGQAPAEMPAPSPDAAADAPDDVPTLRWPYAAPSLPFVHNYFRHERLWAPLAAVLVRLGQQATDAPLLIHAQHAQTTPAAVLAGQRLGVPVVATVRDHWPWDYFATGLHGNALPYRPPTTRAGRAAALTTDLPARLGPLRGALALPALPYMLAHVRRRAAFLARADAVVAVSGYIAERLAPIVPAARLHVLPNMVNMAVIEHTAATPPEHAPGEPFVLFVGKLERNKGAVLLVDIYRALREHGAIERLPLLLVAGTGALRPLLQRELAALGVRARFLAWVPHDEIVRLMACCEVLLFPSAWGEPLSRVLLEAGALGAPMLAMPTGGTPDIIREGENGLLARTPAQFARRLRWLMQHPHERRHLGERARQVARQQFAVEVVLPQVERLYARLCGQTAG
jgi:glycosyltransferase involved in cell wall biosynthesis